jgi:hypothetical protein
MGYDVIGDIHGQFGKLAAMLHALGYRKRAGAFRHPDGRQAIFVGDLIDRGPLQEEVLTTVREMIDAGTAQCVMGNHEWNAIGWATLAVDGVNHLRPRVPHKLKHHREFLDQMGMDTPRHQAWVDWFKTLPVALDLDGIRVVHAWWSAPRIAHITTNSRDGRLTDGFLRESFDPLSAAYAAMEPVTKGPEVVLPGDSAFVDHEGTRRREVRLRWWDDEARHYRAAAMVPESQRDGLPAEPLPDGVEMGVRGSTPLFVGHYWLDGAPRVQHPRLAVLDYGAGLKGPLVAYRWDGEGELCDDKLVAVGGGVQGT